MSAARKIFQSSAFGLKCCPTSKHEELQTEFAERTALFLDALIANSPIAIVVLDAKHRVQMCNPAFERLFLYSDGELRRINLDKLIAPQPVRSNAIRLTKSVLAGRIVHATGTRKRKDGTMVEVEIHGVPLTVKGYLVGVYGLYQDVTERRRNEKALRELSGRLLRSQDEERKRIARELHDSTAQRLTALGMNLSRLKSCDHTHKGRTDRLLNETIELAAECNREIRTLSYLLHPPQLDHIGLAPAISWYADGFAQRSGIRVNLRLPSHLRRLPEESEIALYRVVQESLTNVLRHSKSATALIRIVLSSSHIIVEVADRGRGIVGHGDRTNQGPPSLGVGIAGMRERLRLLGGQLEIASGRRGTKVRAILPLVGRSS